MKDLINNKSKVKILNKVLYELNMEDNISKIFKKEQQYYAKCVKEDIVLIRYENLLMIYLNSAKESWVVDRFERNGMNITRKFLLSLFQDREHNLVNCSMDLVKSKF